MTTQQFLLDEFEREVRRSKRALEQVPDDRYDWKPHERSMIFGYLADMVATIPNWIAMEINRDELDPLRNIVECQPQINIRNGGRVQNSPVLFFPRAHLDDCWGVVREGHGNEIDRQILGGFACSRSSVDDIAICVLDDRGSRTTARPDRLSIGVYQFLVAEDKDALRQSSNRRVDAFDSFDNQRSRCSP